MFCKWCGMNLPNVGKPCPSCGRTQDPLENGNSFWDLCRKKTLPPSAPEPAVRRSEPVQSPMQAARKSQPSRKPAAGSPFWFRAWAATFALLILCAAFLFFGSDSGEQEKEPYLQGSNPAESRPVDNPGTDDPLQPGIPVMLLDEDILPADPEDLTVTFSQSLSQPDKWILEAQGELLQTENTQIHWQMRTDSDDSWQTIPDKTFPQLTVDSIRDGAYRVVCVLKDTDGIHVFCGYIQEDLTAPVSSDTPDK